VIALGRTRTTGRSRRVAHRATFRHAVGGTIPREGRAALLSGLDLELPRGAPHTQSTPSVPCAARVEPPADRKGVQR
jgi:hypothetical protein